MEAFTLSLAMFYGISDDHLGYDAITDRQRFPPDAVLCEWRTIGYAHKAQLQRRLECVALMTSRPAGRLDIIDELEREIAEVDRILLIICYLVPIYPAEAAMRPWMDQARGMMTQEEYRAGYVPFMGLPDRRWPSSRR